MESIRFGDGLMISKLELSLGHGFGRLFHYDKKRGVVVIKI
jgi:hypothetical protein